MFAYGLSTHIWNNRLKSILLLAGFPFLLLLIAFAFALLFSAYGNPDGVGAGFETAFAMLPRIVPWAIVGALIWFFIAWLANRRIISAVTGARAIDRRADPRLWNLLENLCISRGVTMPKLQIIETGARNAFASGVRESQYTVTVTRGLMDTLDDKELEAVLAHELTHIENRDVQLLVVAAIFVGIISFSAHLMMRSPRILVRSGRRGGGSSGGKGAGFLILIAIAIFVIAWVLAIALRFAISCKREYLADAGAVELTKNPDAMIGALLKIAGHSEIEAPEEIQAMLLDHQREGRFARMFASHPSIKDRVAALMRFGGGTERVE